MQTYGRVFADVYNRRWGGFAQHVSPLIRAYCEGLAGIPADKSLLDVCCGTGQLAAHFLEHGYRVVGLDLSPDMLGYARENNAGHGAAGRAAFVQADAADFTLGEQFALAVSTFDALNHLPGEDALAGCFRSVRAALLKGGVFIFDLNTRRGLYDHWNSLQVTDTDDITIINRGIYDGLGDRAYTRISGFVRRENGRYERFAETFTNTVFSMARVIEMLGAAGFRAAHAASSANLSQPVDDPEALPRAFLVARA
jgi:SAM-dependent methyltransferase